MSGAARQAGAPGVAPMTELSGALHAGDESGAKARRTRLGSERELSARIYEYILAGRPDQQAQRGARPTGRPAPR